MSTMQKKPNVMDRLLPFMEAHKIKKAEMARVLRTPWGTFAHWIRDEATPPGCMTLVMDALEQLPEFRKLCGLSEDQRK